VEVLVRGNAPFAHTKMRRVLCPVIYAAFYGIYRCISVTPVNLKVEVRDVVLVAFPDLSCFLFL
jgi:hypothetical protein